MGTKFFAAALACLGCLGPDAHADSTSAADPALFARLDRDGDGRLASKEIADEHQRLFSRLLRRGDANGDEALSREEFLAGLMPSRPEKPLDEKQSAELPQANAVRYLLLTMDADGNSNITADEVPGKLRPAFEAMRERIDRNDNDVLERAELSRGGPQLMRIAVRFVDREGLDVNAELRRLDRKLGPTARRFDQARTPLDALGDANLARELFGRLDTNGDGQLSQKELPEQYGRRIGARMRRVDRNGDGQINEREFLAVVKRLAERMTRQEATQTAPPEKKGRSGAMPADTP
jgi:Ca2+-binding EF-hand superfamily protein